MQNEEFRQPKNLYRESASPKILSDNHTGKMLGTYVMTKGVQFSTCFKCNRQYYYFKWSNMENQQKC